jgi:VanZ family protein
MTRTQTVIFRIVLFLALGAITYLATTRHDYPAVTHVSDKLNHVAAFYVLALLLDFSLPEKQMGFAEILALLAYGVAIEVAQSFLPGRTASLLDLFADAVGIALYKFSLPVVKRLPFLNVRSRLPNSP